MWRQVDAATDAADIRNADDDDERAEAIGAETKVLQSCGISKPRPRQ